MNANAEGENIFTYVVLRSPLLTKKAWSEVENFCKSESLGTGRARSQFLLKELSKRKVKQNYHHIAEVIVECCTVSSDDMTRVSAIGEMTLIYEKANRQLKKIIEQKCIVWLNYRVVLMKFIDSR